VPVCHVPVLSHVWGVCPLHDLVVGVQLPEHTALLHTYWHAVPRSCHCPVELQTCGCSPLQRRSPAVHPASLESPPESPAS
jgi:hypothetical protein